MRRSDDPNLIWLSTDMPREQVAAFTRLCELEHRTRRAQLRVLIERFLAEHDDELAEPAGRHAHAA